MARNKINPIIDKQTLKMSRGCCRLCGESDYAVLDVHRIKPGEEGGSYTLLNSVVLCSNCHRRVHDKQVTIDGYYLSSSGHHLLRIVIDGKEDFV